MSAWVLSGFSPNTCRLIEDSKLPIGVDVIVSGYLSFVFKCQPCDKLTTCPELYYTSCLMSARNFSGPQRP